MEIFFLLIDWECGKLFLIVKNLFQQKPQSLVRPLRLFKVVENKSFILEHSKNMFPKLFSKVSFPYFKLLKTYLKLIVFIEEYIYPRDASKMFFTNNLY